MARQPSQDVVNEVATIITMLQASPATRDDLMAAAGITSYEHWRYVLGKAREEAQQMQMTISRPVADDGWLYLLTGKWDDLSLGFLYGIRDSFTRAGTLLGQVRTAEANTSKKAKEMKHLLLLDAQLSGASATLTVTIGETEKHLVP